MLEKSTESTTKLIQICVRSSGCYELFLNAL